MKNYPLHIQYCIEFEGSTVVSYYSKGHHDYDKFIEAVAGDYEYKGNVIKVYHSYGKLHPSPTGGMLMTYRKLQCKGSFPITIMQVY